MTVAMADRIEMPSAVVAAVDRLARSAEVSASGWTVRSAVLHDRRVEDDESQQWVEAELQILEAVEQVKAWADLQGLVALRRLREAVGEQVRMTDDLSGPIGLGLPPQVLRAESDIAAVDEVVLATGLPQSQVERRLDLAVDADGRAQLLHAALGQGRVSLDRAIRLHHDTRGLGAEEVHAITERLLAPNRDGSIRTDRSFRRELRRQVALHTPDPATAKDDAVSDRTAYASVDPVGTGCLTVTGEAGRVAAAMERVEDTARRLRRWGLTDADAAPQRRGPGPAPLRLGVLRQLLYGWVSCDGESAADVPASTAATFVGQAPVARVSVVVSLGTLLGEEHGVGEISGYGYVSGEHARQLATVIAALDGVCTAPGCTTAAHRCDVDHSRPWPSGPTAIANLSARDRRHHNHKTRGTWIATTDSDGVTLWRTCSGRSYLTGRHRYDDPLGRPVTDAEADEAAAVVAVANPFEDPPPY